MSETASALVNALHVTLLNILTFDLDYVKKMYPESYWDAHMSTSIRHLASLIVDFPGAPLSQRVFDLLFPDFDASQYLEKRPEIASEPSWSSLGPNEQRERIIAHLLQKGMHKEEDHQMFKSVHERSDDNVRTVPSDSILNSCEAQSHSETPPDPR